ncbi:MAG: disulfide isomerase DsbC N-terminal domain-containing protein [Thermodesulfovibrionales bacterium]
MRFLVCAAAAGALLFSAVSAPAFPGKGEDCARCHTLKKEEAAGLLKEVLPRAKVLDVRMSPTKTMWEVAVEAGRKGIVYIDFTKKYLLSGALVELASKKNLTEERLSDINRVNASSIPLSDALVLGRSDARHKVIVFDDPE